MQIATTENRRFRYLLIIFLHQVFDDYTEVNIPYISCIYCIRLL